MVKLLLIGKMERRAYPRKTLSLVTIAYFGNPPIGREVPTLVDLVTFVALTAIEDKQHVLRQHTWTELKWDKGLQCWAAFSPIDLDHPGTSP